MRLAIKEVKDLVYEALFSRIENGNLLPGEKIQIDTLCSDLGVSRTPIKEALLQLEGGGYVEKLPRRGFVLKKLSPETLNEIVGCLGILEGFAATCSLPRISAGDILMMKRLVEDMDDALLKSEYSRYFELQGEFHQVFIARCGNRELEALILSLKMRFLKQNYNMRLSTEALSRDLKKYNEDHKKLILLFEKRDAELIERFLREVHWSKPIGLSAQGSVHSILKGGGEV